MAQKKTTRIVIPGFETFAARLRAKIDYLKSITEEVNEGKSELRAKALEAANSLGGDINRQFTFVGPKGEPLLNATLPDPSSGGNLTLLSEETLHELAEAKLNLFEQVDRHTAYNLTGPWAEWFTTMLKQWAASDVQLPEEGLMYSVTYKLKPEAAIELEKKARSGDEVAQKALGLGTKAVTIAMPR